MIIRNLYLYEKTKLKKLDNSTSYEFDGSKLTIYWNGQKKTLTARLGEAFSIRYLSNYPKISKLNLPNDSHRLLLWLCGFYSYNGATNFNKFKEFLEHERRNFIWSNYHEYGPNTDDYCLIFCNSPNFKGTHHVAAYINRDLTLTTQKIIEILNAYYTAVQKSSDIPVEFVKEILRQRFNFTKLELAKIKFE